MDLERYLGGGDLRTLNKSGKLHLSIKNQRVFDDLFSFLFNADRRVAMRAADQVEKASQLHPEFLAPHKAELVSLARTAVNKELQWHLAQMFGKITLSAKDKIEVNRILKNWLFNRSISKIVRVCSLQTLFDLNHAEGKTDFDEIFSELEKENVPSMNARIKILRTKFAVHD